MEDRNLIYRQRLEDLSRQAHVLDGQVSRIAYARLAVFAIGIALVWYLWPSVAGIGATVVVAAALFIILVKRHDKVFARREHVRLLLEVNEEELQRLGGAYDGYDDGKEFAHDEHPYLSDLDIFGPGGIFQYLSRAGASMGREQLAAWLSTSGSPEEIALRQEAVLEMRDAIDWRQDFQANGRRAAESRKDREELLEWIQEPAYFIHKKWLRIMIFVLPAIGIGLLLGCIFWEIPVNMVLLYTIILLSITGAYNKRISKGHSSGDRKYKILGKYAGLIAKIEEKPFKGAMYQSMYERLGYQGRPAGAHIQRLSEILQALDNRYNLIGYIIANGLYMRELHTAIRLERWKLACRPHMAHWLEATAEADALLGMATVLYNDDSLHMPQVQAAEAGLLLEAEGLGHPLIPADRRVGNPLHIQGWAQFMLVTGSNMAGKSTYLRAVGVNMALAMAGAPVCAARMAISPVQLFSSMRVGDSIRDSESTFYAELKRLRSIIELLSSGQKIFILLDEILRGTNSKDKLTGSIALMHQLMALQGAGIIATHDLQLGELEASYPGHVHNFNFEVSIKDEQFTFDYKLKNGICKTLNATQLMRQMGIKM